MDKLTIKQAIEQGYTHYTIDQTEHYGMLTDLLEFKDDGIMKGGYKLLLIGKERFAFSISATDIQQALESHIENQEDYFCEDDILYEELGEADFNKIAELVNVGFKTGFMFPTEIELDLNELEEE